MIKMDSEVLIYIQKVKSYITNNNDAKNYFIGDCDIEDFIKELSDISAKNYKTNGQPELNEEQFELLRITIKAIKLSKQKVFYSDDGLFMYFENYTPVCMN
jgi:hypothetical protein